MNLSLYRLRATSFTWKNQSTNIFCREVKKMSTIVSPSVKRVKNDAEATPLRILCLGAGATGGYYGGRLLQANAADVSFLVRTNEQVRQLRTHGLKILSPMNGDAHITNVQVFAGIEDDTSKSPYDVFLLSCKSYDLESACDKLQVFVDKHKDAVILPVLNGLAHMDYLDRRFGPERVVGGVSHVATTLADVGIIKQLTAVHRITFGARNVATSRANEILLKLKEAFEKTIVEVKLVDNIDLELWEKFVLLTTLAGSTCLARAAVGDIMKTDYGEVMVNGMLAEFIKASTKAGYAPRLQLKKTDFDRLTEKNSVLTASMMRDMEGSGRTEAHHIVYDMLRRVREAGDPGINLSFAWMVLQARDFRRAREAELKANEPK